MSRLQGRGPPKVTVQSVARLAGVSPMTVSRVVNGAANVSETARAKVLAAVQALNYVPNAAARSLAGARPAHLGLLHANPSAAYLSEFLVGALASCRRAGAQLLLTSCASDTPDEQRRAVRQLIAEKVDGVILPPPLAESPAVLAELAAAELPAVCVAVGRPDPAALTVRIDDFAAAREMTALLLDMGHRRIGFIRGHPNQTASARRWDGFAAAHGERGLPPPAHAEQGWFTYASGLAAAERLLDRRPAPTAIFASNDDMAAAAVNVAHRRGLDVPAQLSVVGFDDTEIARTVWPELTTVRQPIEAMAEAALELLLAELKRRRAGGEPAAAEHVAAYVLVQRASAAPPPVEAG